MKKELLPRFQPHIFFRQTRFQSTFTADDAQSPDRHEVVVRLFQRNKVSINILELTDRLSWYQNIRHTNLVAISEAGFTEHQDLYVVRDFIPQGDVFGKQDIDWLPQLVSLMQFLRHCRQVHGGIKPTNLFVENGILRLADPWTAAARIDLNEDTIHYTAPELFQGCRPTLESDLYAFGCLIYRRLTGTFPFTDPHFENLLTKYLHAKPNPLVELSAADNRLAGGVQALLDKNPAKRLAGLDNLSTLFPHFDVASRAPFVGRDAELNSILSLCSADKRKSLRIACLEGCPGIGKTRLLEEIGRRSKFLNADFINFQISKTFKISQFAEQLREIVTRRSLRGLGTAEQQLGTSNAFLNSFAQNETTSREPLNREARVLGNILVTLTRRNPLVLALDLSANPNLDLERLIEEFCYRADDLGVLLLIAFRPSVRPDRILQFIEKNLGERITVIQLAHLGTQELNVLSRTVSKSIEADVIKLSGGNPLLLESYLKCSTENRKFFRRVQADLSQIEKIVLDAASVLSTDFDVSTLKALCSPHNFPFGSILGSLVERRLLYRVGDQLSFTYHEFPRFIEARLTPNHRKRLHRVAFTARHASGVTLTDTDAYHAFRADLFSEALDLYAGLMRKYRHAGQFSQAINCYEYALKCSARLGQKVSPEDELEVAQCYSLVGKNEVGREICHRLLADEPIISSHLVPKIYTALALSESTGSNAQIEYFRRAIAISENDSQDVMSRLAQLAQSLYLRGRLTESEEIINSAMSSVSTSNRNSKVVMLLAVKGALEVHKSDFKSALKTLQGLRCSNLATRSGVLSNIALCLEQLGSIGKAAVAQQEALRLGRLSGYAVAEIVALANLGGFAVKLGAFSVAEQHFKTIERLIKSSHHANFSQKHVAIAYLEAALFCLETGEYSNATSLFSKAAHSQKELGERDCLAVMILAADIQLRFGRRSAALEILRRMPASETFLTPYFQVEKALLESRIGTATKAELSHALQQSVNMGSVHQQCRLLLAIAADSEASERDSRLETLRKARALSKKHSYRPLNAQCALLTGLMTADVRDRSYRLSEALEMAEDLKLPELIAETSYWLALSQWELGDYLVAQKSLIRSTTLTNTLSQSVPQRYRKIYLAVSWRESAGAKLGEWAQQIVSSVGRARDLPSLKDRQAGLIKVLYGISISDRPALHSKLVNTIDETLHHRTTVVMTKHQGKTVWDSNRIKNIEDLRNRVSSLSEKSSSAPHFGHAIQDRGTAAWIPLQSQDILGGIYVECNGPGDRLTEQELEFLTVVGALANGALTRIQADSVKAVKSENISEFHGIVGKSRAIRQVCHHIEIAAGNVATVLIEGESGTGKELVARAIHLCSGRAKGPFVPVDCGAIPETLIESELFGSRKGSFTGAVADRAGLFEAAHGGTLFLDEISNTSAGLQARLLRVIQEREVRRIGETKGRTVDVRLIVATNTNLDQLVKQKQFRQDLLFRLKVLHIPMPPLRNRREDIPQLVETFVAKLNATHRQKKHVTTGLLNQLSALDYPGNVRELQNLVERAYAFTPGSAIVSAPVEEPSTPAHARATDETQILFKDLIEGRKDFWSTVYARYKRRDISREKVQALVDLGLRSTRGHYKTLASMFRVKDKEYRRFMDFLRRSHCELDFRPYRKADQ